MSALPYKQTLAAGLLATVGKRGGCPRPASNGGQQTLYDQFVVTGDRVGQR